MIRNKYLDKINKIHRTIIRNCMVHISRLNVRIIDLDIESSDKCIQCQRKLPNKKFKTTNGCLWCDNKYYREKEKKSGQ